MLRGFVTFVLVMAVGLVISLGTGCETEAQNDALIGTAVGAGIGALAGGDTEGALVGAAIGGGVGYVAGNEADKKKTQQQMQQIRAEQNTVTVWITNSNGSQTPVKLTRSGPSFIGPRGEHYATMPSAEDLAKVYGF